jgi:antitoxin (DNA-binding transcriptional repressor) of toxin-antitoxin stability system
VLLGSSIADAVEHNDAPRSGRGPIHWHPAETMVNLSEPLRVSDMNVPINAKRSRATLPDVVERVRKGTRFTVIYLSRPAFQIVPVDDRAVHRRMMDVRSMTSNDTSRNRVPPMSTSFAIAVRKAADWPEDPDNSRRVTSSVNPGRTARRAVDRGSELEPLVRLEWTIEIIGWLGAERRAERQGNGECSHRAGGSFSANRWPRLCCAARLPSTSSSR